MTSGKRARTFRNPIVAWIAIASILLPANAWAGAYVLAGDTSNGIPVSTITHPVGYTGTGGPLTVTVCVNPASPNAAAMEAPVQRVVDTWNALTPVIGNVDFSSDVPGSSFDFESVALHEVGHCIGLAHPNAASESGLTGANTNYTKANVGLNASFDLSNGADNVIGSSDDLRGDDVNLHWFRTSNNDPFTVATTVDSTTYSQSLASLPSATPSRRTRTGACRRC